MKNSAEAAVVTTAQRIVLASAMVCALAGCVSTQDGKKKFAPIEAAQHLDQNVGDAEDQYLQ